jgi:broad specificity phosphatase PhoE
VETASLASEPLGIPIFKSAGLREAFLGDAQGLTAPELRVKFGDTLVERWRSPFQTDADVAYPGGETGTQVLQRVLDALRSHLEKTAAERIGISTHGGVIRRVVRSLIGESEGMIPIPNGILYSLEWSGAFRELRFLAATPFKERAGS